jgi:hypothetical protein
MKSALLSLLVATASAAHSILDCSELTQGIETTVAQEFANAKCFEQSVMAAQNDQADRVAFIPQDVVVTMMPTAFTHLKDVTIEV